VIEVRSHDGETPIYLIPVSHMTTAHDAAYALWQNVFTACKIYGGIPFIKTPEDGENGFLVSWEGGPPQWADAYAVDPEASARGFTVESEDGNKVRFTDLD